MRRIMLTCHPLGHWTYQFLEDHLRYAELAMDSVDYDPEQLIEAYFERGWTDGLPVVPPTEKSIAAMLAGAALRGDETIGEIAERGVVVSAEKLAINAVMAGCRPEYLPVVVAAVRRLCHLYFVYHGTASSTVGSVMVIILCVPQ